MAVGQAWYHSLVVYEVYFSLTGVEATADMMELESWKIGGGKPTLKRDRTFSVQYLFCRCKCCVFKAVFEELTPLIWCHVPMGHLLKVFDFSCRMAELDAKQWRLAILKNNYDFDIGCTLSSN